jgi:hypothetical protein
MARKLRIEYPGAIYHVLNRGDRREDIFRDDQDREWFLATLAEACGKADGCKWGPQRVYRTCYRPRGGDDDNQYVGPTRLRPVFGFIAQLIFTMAACTITAASPLTEVVALLRSAVATDSTLSGPVALISVGPVDSTLI